MAYSIDKTKMVSRLVLTGHFLLYLIALVVYIIHETNAAPPQWSPALKVIAGVLATLGYGLGAAWSPPRRPWTNEERVANGLQPLPPPRADGDVRQPPPPLPPPPMPGEK